MPTQKVESIINLIDNIDGASAVSEMDVSGAMLDAYNKSYKILESYTGEDIDTFELVSSDIYQEDFKVGDPDEAKGETRFRRINDKTGKKENILWSIVMAIPRIIGAIISALSKSNKNQQADDTMARGEVALDTLMDKNSDEAKKSRVREAVNKYNKELNNMILMMSAAKLVHDIIKLTNSGDIEETLQINELKALWAKIQEFDTLTQKFKYVADNFEDVSDKLASALVGIAATADIAAVAGSLGQSVFGKRLEKIMNDQGFSNDQEFAILAQKVSNGIRNVGTTVSNACGALNKLTGFLQGVIDVEQTKEKKKEKKKAREERIESGSGSFTDKIWHKKDEMLYILKRKGYQTAAAGALSIIKHKMGDIVENGHLND